MEFRKLREYLGDVAQVFEVKEYRLMGGKAEGVRAIDISNGAGLELTLLPDRGMDFYRLKYKGRRSISLRRRASPLPPILQKKRAAWARCFSAA